jgi:hypothetical protein
MKILKNVCSFATKHGLFLVPLHTKTDESTIKQLAAAICKEQGTRKTKTAVAKTYEKFLVKGNCTLTRDAGIVEFEMAKSATVVHLDFKTQVSKFPQDVESITTHLTHKDTPDKCGLKLRSFLKALDPNAKTKVSTLQEKWNKWIKFGTMEGTVTEKNPLTPEKVTLILNFL